MGHPALKNLFGPPLPRDNTIWARKVSHCKSRCSTHMIIRIMVLQRCISSEESKIRLEEKLLPSRKQFEEPVLPERNGFHQHYIRMRSSVGNHVPCSRSLGSVDSPFRMNCVGRFLLASIIRRTRHLGPGEPENNRERGATGNLRDPYGMFTKASRIGSPVHCRGWHTNGRG